MPRLENWSIFAKDDNPFVAPELKKKYLQGEIYGDERFKDGTIINTSSIQEFNIEERYAKTRNTTYVLGEVFNKYLKWMEDNEISLQSGKFKVETGAIFVTRK